MMHLLGIILSECPKLRTQELSWTLLRAKLLMVIHTSLRHPAVCLSVCLFHHHHFYYVQPDTALHLIYFLSFLLARVYSLKQNCRPSLCFLFSAALPHYSHMLPVVLLMAYSIAITLLPTENSWPWTQEEPHLFCHHYRPWPMQIRCTGQSYFKSHSCLSSAP